MLDSRLTPTTGDEEAMKIEDEAIFERNNQPMAPEAPLHPALVRLVQALARYAAQTDFDAALAAAKAMATSPESKPNKLGKEPGA